MNISFNNKHAFICGSTDGIGKASALVIAEHGCEITLIARNQEKLDSTLMELARNNDQNHSTVCADFDDPETAENIDKEIKIISICWALNETLINKQFWTQALQRQENSLIIIIEGEIGPLLQLIEILDVIDRKYLEKYDGQFVNFYKNLQKDA